MPTKNRPYEQFGDYILLKRLELDGLGELFRAVRIQQGGAGPAIALRRLSGGNREAFAAAAEQAGEIVPSLTGPTFAKDQTIGVIAGTAFVAHDYASGRSLRYIVDRARGMSAATPTPIPLDQAIVIAERAALSLATTGELRRGNERLVHGGLIPQFIWITEDGEIRVAGQGLASGFAASLRDEKIAADIGRYFSPETQHSGQASKSTEVYSLGAILFLLVTGQEPPDATRTSAFSHAIRAGKTMTGEPIPEDIRGIIEKSLNIDPAGRFATPTDMRNALSALSASGKYAATSFNLAFYLSNLLKKEMEAEVVERQREAALDVAPYLAVEAPAAPTPAFAAAAQPPIPMPPAEPGAAEKKSKVPVAIAATVALAAAGVGAWYYLGSKQQKTPAGAIVTASAIPTPTPVRQPLVVPEPIVATPEPATDTTATSPVPATDTESAEAARKKMFEEAVKKRLQQEMLKLQAEYTRELQQQQARNAPLLSTAPPTTQPARQEERPSAAQLDQQRREESISTEQVPTPTATTASASPAPVIPTATVATQTIPPPAPVAPAVREGDVVGMESLDRAPDLVREPRPAYPPIAARQKIEATVMASILVSETGEVLDVKILRGEPRFGFNDAAIRAFRGARYSPAMKDGKRVKTWVPQMIHFKP
jgi:TonB family protein